MRNLVSKAALAITLALGGGVGSARELGYTERVIAAMNRGLDRTDAISEASRAEPVGYSPDLARCESEVASAMSAGVDHVAAIDAMDHLEAAAASATVIARRQRVDYEIAHGENPAQAWSEEVAPTTTTK